MIKVSIVYSYKKNLREPFIIGIADDHLTKQ